MSMSYCQVHTYFTLKLVITFILITAEHNYNIRIRPPGGLVFISTTEYNSGRIKGFKT